jgi:high-affinity K+ transport system ATPase subunit B
MVKNEAPFFGYTTFHNQPLVLYRKKVGRFLFVVETAELLNIFLIVLMALFLNAQGRAQFPVQILCFLMNRRAFQTFGVGCAGEKGLQDL